MIETIALWIGYIIIIASGLALIGILMWITYITYDYYLKKLLGWKNPQVRKDIFYFIKHTYFFNVNFKVPAYFLKILNFFNTFKLQS